MSRFSVTGEKMQVWCGNGFGWARAGCYRLLVVFVALVLLSGCSLPQVKAEDRLFLPLSLDFLGAYQLPKMDFQETRVGGLSGLSYDRQRDLFYAISDDRSNFAPARFYTLKLALNPVSNSTDPDMLSNSTDGIRTVTIEQVTILKGENGEPFAAGTVDPEGIALSPRQSLFISSEGDTNQGIAPFIDEFDLETGNWRGRLPIPGRYLPRMTEDGQHSGVQNNQGFEALTLSAGSYGSTQLEPFRLFAATESALLQDLNPAPGASTPIRLMHYLIGEDQSLLLDEHLYLVDPAPEEVDNQGLSELVVLDGGHLLGLERSFGITGFGGKLYQLVMGGATDITSIPALSGGTTGITPIYKRLLLDLGDLGIPLDNFEGMAIGPQLSDGSRSLVLISDDNFNELQVTELLLFRLRRG